MDSTEGWRERESMETGRKTMSAGARGVASDDGWVVMMSREAVIVLLAAGKSVEGLTETREVSEEILELIIRCRISVREFESVCAAMSKTLFPDGKGEGQCGSE